MLKPVSIIIVLIFSLLVSSCSMGKKQYHMSKKERGKQHFWVRQSNKLISKNLENKEKNQKEADKRKAKEQKDLTKLNAKKFSNQKKIESFQFFVY